MKKIWLVLGCIGLLILSERSFHAVTDGFYESRIITDIPNRAEWEIKIAPPQEALTQTYHYLGCGSQSFVFASADDKYVLKFFKHHRWKKNHLKTWFRDMKNVNIYRDHTLRSAIYALEYLPSESLVEYVHLNRGNDQLPTVTCVDRLGRKHYFDLNKYQFVIQRKGCTLKERLVERKAHGDLEGARQDIRQILDLFSLCHHKGIINHDPHMTRNFGFVGDTPIVIDSGAFWEYRGETSEPLSEKEVHKGTHQLLKWTKENFPALTQEIEDWKTSYSKPIIAKASLVCRRVNESGSKKPHISSRV